jgi:hypothetical protein
MTESMPDFSTLVENYANFIVDGMDQKSLTQFVFDTLYNTLTTDYETVEDLIDEIRQAYDDDVVNQLIEV